MFLEAENLRQAGITHGFFTRRGGVSEGLYGSLNCGLGSADDRVRVVENRSRVTAKMAPADCLLTVYQVHSPDVATVEAPWVPEDAPKADAMVTNRAGVALGVLTADCAPVLLADPEARVIGAAHAGWRGAIGGVVAATVEAMVDLGAVAGGISAAVGPTIGPESYEVGDDVRDQFLAGHGDNVRYFTSSGDRWLLDLPGYVVRQLEASGVTENTVLARDTLREEDTFFSYRRSCKQGESDYGRQVSAIVLA